MNIYSFKKKKARTMLWAGNNDHLDDVDFATAQALANLAGVKMPSIHYASPEGKGPRYG
jgi:hypothetical protein